MKSSYRLVDGGGVGLSPHGESGLKSINGAREFDVDRSLPAWGEWIEISPVVSSILNTASLSPHGESGLKCLCSFVVLLLLLSLPAWGEWIEMVYQKL